MKPLSTIRNFCIIAHIDHGKSTLADRFLELTGTVAKRDMQEQLLDQMDIERERGITVKLAPVRMQWQGIELNLIDTPGHVDFSYEVSRSLAAVEGAILVVDATQGIQAQTLANLDLAKQQGLVVIPVINKIDLPNADVDQVADDLARLLHIPDDSILRVSAKTGIGVTAILDRVVRDVPPPTGSAERPLRALIFDSMFDTYQGVVTYVRVVDGQLLPHQHLQLMATASATQALDLGMFTPKRVPTPTLQAGEIGYIVTGLKEVAQARVGDTITGQPPSHEALPGYRELKPMVFAGIFTQAGDEYPKLRDAMGKLKLNDAALSFEPEQSPALGFGFRCGFLGLLHLDIVRERLQREYGMDVLVTVPSVGYRVYQQHQPEPLVVRSPLQLPDPSTIARIEEPVMKLSVVTPTDTIGAVMQATQDRRGTFLDMEYLDPSRAVLHFSIPLASILVDYYDILKSVTSGYASLNYELDGYRPADVVRMDILVAGDMVEPLSTMVYRDWSQRAGRKVVEALKELLPRQMFEVKIQAAIGGKVIASERLPAMRKDVTAKLYGGDVTRKRKLLEKQKKGKARMKAMGKVDIPQSAYLAVLKH
ncbi:MAG: elongation factor 4 [Candidatus Kerfeldbacteria bacterium]|nr:elongation factor 4 [Candidatus Kerfeldbacteria bacterium]